MDVLKIIQAFDKFLEKEGVKFEATIIGGAALSVMKIISRETIDVDCLSPKIPDNILACADKFRSTYPEFNLIPNWLNNGPDSLLQDLGPDWENRTVEIFKGKSIHLKTLARIDLIKTKMFAYCDRLTDLQDCIALDPNEDELKEVLKWIKQRDSNPGWPEYVEKQFSFFKSKQKEYKNENN
jgi:hypothetical protein